MFKLMHRDVDNEFLFYIICPANQILNSIPTSDTLQKEEPLCLLRFWKKWIVEWYLISILLLHCLVDFSFCSYWVISFILDCGDLYCTHCLNCVLLGCSSLGCKKWSKANEAQRSHRQCPCSSFRPFWKVGCYMHISCNLYYTSFNDISSWKQILVTYWRKL